MKKSLLFASLIALFSLSLTSCNDKKDSSSSSLSITSSNSSTVDSSSIEDSTSVHVDSTSSTSSGTVNAITSWKQEDIQTMQTLLGLTIPVAPVSENYFLDVLEDEYGEFILISDETVGDLSNQYGMVLENNGYQFDDNVEATEYKDGFLKEYSKDIDSTSFVVIQIGYFLETTEDPAAFDIYAWVEFDIVDYEKITDWRDEDKTLMEEILTEVIPVAPITSEYEISVETDAVGDFIYITDMYSGDVCDEYISIIETYGYEFVNNGIEDPTCSIIVDYYKNLDETSDLYLEIDYFLGDDEFYPVFEICAWIEPVEETFSEWPDAKITQIIESYSLNMKIAPYEGAKSYTVLDYGSEEGAFFKILVYGVDETSVETYKEILDSTFVWTTYKKEIHSVGDYKYDAYFAVDGALTNVIEYYYYEEDSALFIDYSCWDVPPKDDWPLTDIQEYTDIEIPGLAGEFYEVYYGTIAIYNPEYSEQDYVNILTEANWTIDDSNYDEDGYYTVDPTCDLGMYFFMSEDNCFYIILDINNEY